MSIIVYEYVFEKFYENNIIYLVSFVSHFLLSISDILSDGRFRQMDLASV